MKYLVLLVVLVVAFGIWRSRRANETTSRPGPAPRALTQDMLACAHCGVHVPQAEALVAGPHAYCCAEHQRLGPA